MHPSVGALNFFFRSLSKMNRVVNSFKTSLFDVMDLLGVMDLLDVIHFGDATNPALVP